MAWFKNLSFRIKLLIPLAIVILATTVVCFLSLSAIGRMEDESGLMSSRLVPAVQMILEADRDLHQALIAERGLLYSSPGTADFEAHAASRTDNAQQASDRMTKVISLTQDQQARSLANRFVSQLEEWKTESDRVASLAQRSRSQAADLSFGESGAAFDNARGTIDQLTEFLNKEVDLTTDRLAIEAEEVHVKQLVGSGIVFFLLIIVAGTLPPFVIQNINAVRIRVDDIARGEGDLTQRLPVTSNDEFGRLAESFNRFLAKLQRTVTDVASYTHQVAAAAHQLSRVSDANSKLVTEQHDAIDMVVTATSEMTSAIQDVAQHTAGAASESQAAAGQSEGGTRQVQKSIHAMTSLRDSVESARAVIVRLAEDAAQISSVLTVIQGVAEQTNLLALNAAIEAARAGEQGRGFAVVADEVRTLAQRTQQSTQNIAETIGRLQDRVTAAVDAMESGTSEAGASLIEAQHTEKVLAGIAQSIQNINGMNIQIASSAEEQSSVTDEISRNMVTIGEQSRQVESGSVQTSEASAALAQLAKQLQGVVTQFKV